MSSAHNANVPTSSHNVVSPNAYHSLPNEIFQYFISYTLGPLVGFKTDPWPEPYLRKDALRLSLVDRHWNELVMPYLYRFIEVELASDSKVAHFLKKLQEIESLRGHIQGFSVVATDTAGAIKSEAFGNAQKMLTLMPDLKHFRLLGGFSKHFEQTQELMGVVLAKGSLRQLHLHGMVRCLTINNVAAFIGSANMVNELTLFGGHSEAPKREFKLSQQVLCHASVRSHVTDKETSGIWHGINPEVSSVQFSERGRRNTRAAQVACKTD